MLNVIQFLRNKNIQTGLNYSPTTVFRGLKQIVASFSNSNIISYNLSIGERLNI